MDSDIQVGRAFRVYNRQLATNGVVTKINRMTVEYDAPYFKTPTSPDGWLRGLKIRKADLDDAEWAKMTEEAR